MENENKIKNEEMALTENDIEFHEPAVQNDVQSNWNFFQNSQKVKPYASIGGTNKTPSQVKAKYKRKHNTLQQKNSRRINRTH